MTSNPKNPFTGHWRITEMEVWDQDFVNLLGSGYFEFGKEDSGEFRFGAVQGQMDCRLGTVDGESRIEFTWDGDDEDTPVNGRGWAAIRNGQLFGMVYIHLGDDSWFKAKKA